MYVTDSQLDISVVSIFTPYHQHTILEPKASAELDVTGWLMTGGPTEYKAYNKCTVTWGTHNCTGLPYGCVLFRKVYPLSPDQKHPSMVYTHRTSQKGRSIRLSTHTHYLEPTQPALPTHYPTPRTTAEGWSIKSSQLLVLQNGIKQCSMAWHGTDVVVTSMWAQ